jgi:hypothetical protein
MPEMKQFEWKRTLHKSYETMALMQSQLNFKVKPAGFRKTGKFRQIKQTCLLSRIKTKCKVRGTPPKMAVCITMYNEKEDELITTLRGVIHNYNELRNDKSLKF